MKIRPFTIIISITSSLLLGALSAHLDQPAKADQGASKGILEIECNMADVDLNICPIDKFERKAIRKFFGLFTSYQDSCIGKKFFLGTTPLEPVELPEGTYVLLIPSGYVLEHQSPIEFSVAGWQKTYLLLKVLKQYKGYGKGGFNDTGTALNGFSRSEPSADDIYGSPPQ